MLFVIIGILLLAVFSIATIWCSVVVAKRSDSFKVSRGKWILKDTNGNGVCSVCNRQDKIDCIATNCRYCGALLSDEVADEMEV